MMRRGSLFARAMAAGAVLLAGRQAEADPYAVDVVMRGLANPRGLAFGPDGGLYVAEAGAGGDGPSIALNNGQVASYGATGGVSRLLGGRQERVLSGLPSLAPAGGAEATGLHDLAFAATGEVYGVVGLGADPAARAGLGFVGAAFGTLVRLDFAARSFGVHADLAAFEAATNPVGAPDSNPFAIVATPGGFAVADAGSNAVLGVSPAGAIGTLAVLPREPNPLPFGPPSYDAVPTSLAVAADGTIHVGQLTGFPFPPGAADVFRLGPGTLDPAFGGFTLITDLTFGPDGGLYVLELSTNLLTGGTPASGALTRIDPRTGGRATILGEGLVLPTSVAVGPDGSIYVTSFGTSADGGQVLRLGAVPEPGSIALLGTGLGVAALAAWTRRRR